MSCFKTLTVTIGLLLSVAAVGESGIAATTDIPSPARPAAPNVRLAARAEPARAPDPVEEDPAIPYTVEKARGECWMKLETDRKAPRELEKRAALVNKCADEKMKERAAH